MPTSPAGTGAAPAAARRPRLLFVAEAVTLAHVARPAALQASLDPERFDTFFACDRRGWRHLTVPPERRLALDSLDAAVFTERLRRGQPVYDEAQLQRYVHADLALIEQVRPDLIVGDFRLSLQISARLAQVPYAGITNAYWSPHGPLRALPLPVLPWTRFVPLEPAQRIFDLVQRPALAAHCAALNTVRVAHGFARLPADLRQVYTEADHVLYADSPALFPLPAAPPSHRHLGPVLWSPPGALPAWWSELPADRPLVYITMGSSGVAGLLERVIDALAGHGPCIVASTAGAPLPQRRWPDVWCADYLPGERAAARAALVVCNGGSPTAQQALAAGVPVLGICGNMDQMLNMRGLASAGAGTALRADRLTPTLIRTAARRMLEGPRPAASAAKAWLAPDFRAAFADFVGAVLAIRA